MGSWSHVNRKTSSNRSSLIIISPVTRRGEEGREGGQTDTRTFPHPLLPSSLSSMTVSGREVMTLQHYMLRPTQYAIKWVNWMRWLEWEHSLHLHVGLETFLDPPAVRTDSLQVLELVLVTPHDHFSNIARLWNTENRGSAPHFIDIKNYLMNQIDAHHNYFQMFNRILHCRTKNYAEKFNVWICVEFWYFFSP